MSNVFQRTVLCSAVAMALASPAWADVNLSASMPTPTQPWYLDEVHNFVVTMTNTGTDTSTAYGGNFDPSRPSQANSVYFSAPLETNFEQPLPHGCVARPQPNGLSQHIDCPLPALATGEEVTFTFPVRGIELYPTGTGAGLDLRLAFEFTYDRLTGSGVETTNLAFVGGPFYIDPMPPAPPPPPPPPPAPPAPTPPAPPVGQVTPVPTMGHVGIVLLGTGLAGLAIRRRHGKAKDETPAG